MAVSPDKLRAYGPLLAVLVAELVAEYQSELQQPEGAADADNSTPTDDQDGQADR